MRKRIISMLLAAWTMLTLTVPTAAVTPAGAVQVNGRLSENELTVTVSVHDLKMNVIELYLAYDATRLSPVGDADTLLTKLQASYNPYTDEGWMDASAAIDEEHGVIRCLVMTDSGARGGETLDDEGYLTVGSSPVDLFSLRFSLRADMTVYADSVHLGLSSGAPTGIVIADGTTRGITNASVVSIDLGTASMTPEGVAEGYFGGRPAAEEPDPPENSGTSGNTGNTGTSGNGGAPGNSGGNATTPTPGTAFSDTAAHWAKASIEKLVAAGAISGYTDGTFRPNGTLTRGEFCAVLSRCFGLTPDHEAAAVFTDTAEHWSAGYVGAVHKAKLVSGIGDGKFAPDAPITREEMVSILARATGAEGGELNFTDRAEISAWAADSVAAMVRAGLISGYPDGSFRPHNHVTRGEMATVMAQIMPQTAV